MLFGRKPNPDILDLFILSGFAFAQPVFDLLARNASFFVAHQAGPLDLILLVLGSCLLLPTSFLLLESGASWFGPKCKNVTHMVLVASLSGAILLPFLKRLERLPGIIWLLVSLALGLAFALTYLRFRNKRVSLVFLSPTVVLFPALFLTNSPVRKAVSDGGDVNGVFPEIHSTAPIVMVIFDEFPLVTLLDELQGIDSNLFPNFATLSKEATWYRNATSVAEGTLNAVPAILDGLYPSLDPQLPNAGLLLPIAGLRSD